MGCLRSPVPLSVLILEAVLRRDVRNCRRSYMSDSLNPGVWHCQRSLPTCDDGRVPARPKMNSDPDFLAEKIGRIHDLHVAPLNALVEQWRQEGRAVPWVDPDSGGVDSRILFLLESPGPASSAEHGSGVISTDNNDQTAARFWRLSTHAGLDRASYISWNVVPWYISENHKSANATAADGREALPYLHQFIQRLPALRIVVVMGVLAESCWLRYLRRPDSPVLPLVTTAHPSASSRRGRPAFEQDIAVAMAKARVVAGG